MQHSALMGPAITIGSTGNVYQAGFSYASTQAIKYKTGSYPSKLLFEFLKGVEAKKRMTEEQFEIFLKKIGNKKKKTQEFIILVDNQFGRYHNQFLSKK